MLKELINFILEKKMDRAVDKKTRQIRKRLPAASLIESTELFAGYKKKWKPLAGEPDARFYYLYWQINGIESDEYIPENVYYNRIEPVLNDKGYALAYADKNIYERVLPEFKSLFPKAYLRGINGNLYDENYALLRGERFLAGILAMGREYILKPATETSGGLSVKSIGINRDGDMEMENRVYSPASFCALLKAEFNGNFILQEKIAQHAFFSAFNESSVNTVRIFTYRSVASEEVHPLQAVLRFGRPGSLVDNQASGGWSCGISENGDLNSFAVDKYGRRSSELPGIIQANGKSVPGFAGMRELAIKIAGRFPFQRLLGFDFCLDRDGNVRLLEINCKNLEINFLQMNNGPLFGKYTDEIIAFCKVNIKSLVLDFHV